jgi:hypothetical protein
MNEPLLCFPLVLQPPQQQGEETLRTNKKGSKPSSSSAKETKSAYALCVATSALGQRTILQDSLHELASRKFDVSQIYRL